MRARELSRARSRARPSVPAGGVIDTTADLGLYFTGAAARSAASVDGTHVWVFGSSSGAVHIDYSRGMLVNGTVPSVYQEQVANRTIAGTINTANAAGATGTFVNFRVAKTINCNIFGERSASARVRVRALTELSVWLPSPVGPVHLRAAAPTPSTPTPPPARAPNSLPSSAPRRAALTPASPARAPRAQACPRRA